MRLTLYKSNSREVVKSKFVHLINFGVRTNNCFEICYCSYTWPL